MSAQETDGRAESIRQRLRNDASADRMTRCRAYVTRNGLDGAPTDFQQVGDLLTRFP